MHAILLYHTGLRVEAVLLAAANDRMRVAVRNTSDTVELRQVSGQWVSETGMPVEFESLIPMPGTEFVSFCSELRPLALAVGRPFWTV